MATIKYMDVDINDFVTHPTVFDLPRGRMQNCLLRFCMTAPLFPDGWIPEDDSILRAAFGVADGRWWRRNKAKLLKRCRRRRTAGDDRWFVTHPFVMENRVA